MSISLLKTGSLCPWDWMAGRWHEPRLEVDRYSSRYGKAAGMLKDRENGCWLAWWLPHAVRSAGNEATEASEIQLVDWGGWDASQKGLALKTIKVEEKIILCIYMCICLWIQVFSMCALVCMCVSFSGGSNHCKSPAGSYIVPVTETCWKHWAHNEYNG